MISGYGDSQNIIYGLDIGADDYITKPVIPDVLIARVKAILRRPNISQESPILTYKDIKFYTGTKEVFVGNTQVFLTKNEILILELFISQIGKVVSREELITHVWGACNEELVSDNNINVTLSKIRKKLEGNFIPKTLYNQGYLLEE